MEDVTIIGGSFAGLAAALQLGRGRRQVTVLDTGLNRNRYAHEAHNIFGFDGVPPSQILATARAQLATYPSVKLIAARAETASGAPDAFTVTTDAGETITSRRLLLAYGITDEFPAIPGFAEAWGNTVIHCPFCHGYEVAGQRWALLYAGAPALHALALYRDWTDQLTLILDGHQIEPEVRDKILASGIAIEDGKLTAIDQVNGTVKAVTLDNGKTLALDALFAHPRNRPSANLHEQLGLVTSETFTGSMITVEGMQQTSRPGIFAAGDLATGMHSVTISTHAGSMAAIGLQQSMLKGF